MTRGTTPSYVITITDFENLEGQKIEVTFKQNDIVIVLDKDDINVERFICYLMYMVNRITMMNISITTQLGRRLEILILTCQGIG